MNDLTPTELVIYPNPSNGELNIKTENTLTNARIQIRSLSGQVVYEGIITSQVTEIELSVPNGMYFVQVQSPEGNICQKVIVSSNE
jgi:hypothetical protein